MTKENKFHVTETNKKDLVLVFPVEQVLQVSIDDVLTRVAEIYDEAMLIDIRPITTNGKKFVPVRFKRSSDSVGVMMKFRCEYSCAQNLSDEVELLESAFNEAVYEMSNRLDAEIVTAYYEASSSPELIELDDYVIIINVMIGDEMYG
jgi:hypothetical protein